MELALSRISVQETNARNGHLVAFLPEDTQLLLFQTVNRLSFHACLPISCRSAP